MKQPRSRSMLDAQPSFGGGLNTIAAEDQLATNELRRADNFRLSIYGAAVKRGGTQRLHTSTLAASGIQGAYQWDASGQSLTQIVVANSTLYTGTYSGTFPITFTAQSGLILGANTSPVSFAGFRDSANDVVYMAAGGQVQKWDGTTLSTLSAGPVASMVCMHNLRLFSAGDPQNPDTLSFSGLGNGDTLGDTNNGGGVAIIRTFGRQAITGLLSLGPNLYIFHKTGISVFTGYSLDDIAIASGTQGLSPDVGTIAPRTITSVEQAGFFLTDRGVFKLTATSGVESVSMKVEDKFRLADKSLYNGAWAVHHKAKSEVLVYVPAVGVYCYNYRINAWTGPWDTLFAASQGCAWLATDTTASPIVLIGGADGFVRQLDRAGITKDDVLADGTGGTTLTATLRCHRLLFKDAFFEKALRFGYVLGDLVGSVGDLVMSWVAFPAFAGQSSYTTNLPVATAAASWDASWDGSWGQGSTPVRVPMWGRGASIDVTLADSSVALNSYSRIEVEALAVARRF